MTCERYERDLALAVEGDLPERPGARLDEHLRRCARCQEFLRGLEESQRRLKELAAEPVDDRALAAVRTRVAAALREPGYPARVVPAWAWAVAASLALVALGLTWFVFETRSAVPPQAARVVAPPLAPRPGPSAVPGTVGKPSVTWAGRPSEGATAPQARRSTVRPPRPVSQGVEGETAGVVPRLSPEDAEQLARAVVAVSRVRRLRDEPSAAPAEPPPPALVRLETSDPGVVIYWQLDANGG